MRPLRILTVVSNPKGLPKIDDARVARDMADALGPLVSSGAIAIERLGRATENDLRQKLARSCFEVLHLVAHGQARSAVRYGTVALEASDGQVRNVTAPRLAEIAQACDSLRLVVLQAWEGSHLCFEPSADALIAAGLPAVVCAGAWDSSEQRLFLSKLYSGVRAGLTASQLREGLLAAVPGLSLSVAGRAMDEPLLPVPAAQVAAASVPLPPGPLSSPASVAPSPEPPSWQRELKRKRAEGKFDVFLCHNTADKPAVIRLAQRLKEAGLLVWLDIWELPPGRPWQPLLEEQIGNIKSSAVFVGSAGIGPWQEQEIYSFLREFVARKAPVIPVLLEDAPARPELPIFLQAMTWVDFRTTEPDPFGRLVWGITGRRPDD
jgi:hypothetical protein